MLFQFGRRKEAGQLQAGEGEGEAKTQVQKGVEGSAAGNPEGHQVPGQGETDGDHGSVRMLLHGQSLRTPFVIQLIHLLCMCAVIAH